MSASLAPECNEVKEHVFFQVLHGHVEKLKLNPLADVTMHAFSSGIARVGLLTHSH